MGWGGERSIGKEFSACFVRLYFSKLGLPSNWLGIAGGHKFAATLVKSPAAEFIFSAAQAICIHYEVAPFKRQPPDADPPILASEIQGELLGVHDGAAICKRAAREQRRENTAGDNGKGFPVCKGRVDDGLCRFVWMHADQR